MPEATPTDRGNLNISLVSESSTPSRLMSTPASGERGDLERIFGGSQPAKSSVAEGRPCNRQTLN